jgi:hypothetical protein
MFSFGLDWNCGIYKRGRGKSHFRVIVFISLVWEKEKLEKAFNLLNNVQKKAETEEE